MRKKKEKEINENFKIINDYNHDIEIVKKILNTVNVAEHRINQEDIDYKEIVEKLKNLGIDVKKFNTKYFEKSNISHEFLIAKLLDEEKEIKILIDLNFIIFYPYSDINERYDVIVGNNLLSMKNGLQIINNLIINGYMQINEISLKTYLSSFCNGKVEDYHKCKKIKKV